MKLELARLYLRPVEALKGEPCGVYELEAYYSKMTKAKKVRKTYKIFTGKKELDIYLKKNPNKKALVMESKFRADMYHPPSDNSLRELSPAEIALYISEKEEQTEEWRNIIKQYMS